MARGRCASALLELDLTVAAAVAAVGETEKSKDFREQIFTPPIFVTVTFPITFMRAPF